MSITPKKSRSAWAAPTWSTNSIGVAVSRVINQGHPITTQTNNTVYRLGDVVGQRGHLWLASSLQILSRPEFRRTLLRALLSRIATHDGQRLVDLPDSAVEELAAKNWVCQNTTWSDGRTLAYNGMPLSSHWNCPLWVVDEPRLHKLVFEENQCRIIRELGKIVQSRLARNDTDCRPAPPNTAAVHIRLGDKRDIFLPIRQAASDKGAGLAIPVHQQAAAMACTNASYGGET